jgi:hypothetical protein
VVFRATGEQHITPWVLMLGKHAPKVPMLVFNIVRSGDEIRRVNVEVRSKHSLRGFAGVMWLH